MRDALAIERMKSMLEVTKRAEDRVELPNLLRTVCQDMAKPWPKQAVKRAAREMLRANTQPADLAS